MYISKRLIGLAGVMILTVSSIGSATLMDGIPVKAETLSAKTMQEQVGLENPDSLVNYSIDDLIEQGFLGSYEAGLGKYLLNMPEFKGKIDRNTRFTEKDVETLGGITEISNIMEKDYDSTKELSDLKGVEYLFPNLKVISLWGSKIASIPEGVFTLDTLEQLNLAMNQITTIPKDLRYMGNLRILNLAHNKLTGEIPEELGEIGTLSWLNLSRNNLTGTLPDSFGNLQALHTLNLEHNRLSGGLKPYLSNITEPKLSYNSFSGPIDETLKLGFSRTTYNFFDQYTGQCMLAIVTGEQPSIIGENAQDAIVGQAYDISSVVKAVRINNQELVDNHPDLEVVGINGEDLSDKLSVEYTQDKILVTPKTVGKINVRIQVKNYIPGEVGNGFVDAVIEAVN